MTTRPFQQVDVFTATPYLGNPLAVVLDGSGLSTEAMQAFTNWTNLSECTFVLPPTQAGADYKVRIFCPGRELPFAGHPTLGTCHAWLLAGGQPLGKHIVQECGVGLVKIRRDGQRLAFAAPPSKRTTPAAVLLTEVTRALGLATHDIQDAQFLDNGPVFLTLLLTSRRAVMACQPDLHALAATGVNAAIAAWEPNGTTDIEVRTFGPKDGFDEDPVTGSLNAALAQWLMGAGLAPARYVAAQGTALGRAGRVHIERDDEGSIWVGGESVSCVSGQVTL